MAAESDLEKEICAYAEERGYLQRKLKWEGRRGAPDRFLAHPHAFTSFLVEFKAPGESLRPDQVREIDRLRDAGVLVYVVDNEASGRAIIDAHLVDIL